MHNVPKGSETHFKVVVVSGKFEEVRSTVPGAFTSTPCPQMKALARHRAVNACLAVELGAGVHALSILARSPAQWAEGKAVEPSPACRGGFGK